MSSKRVLGVIRISVLADESTSPARQKEIIADRAAGRGGTVIGWAEDLDVSASKVHPMQRPELAKWLARPQEYDEVIFWRLDRFVRKTFPDFADMLAWSLEHDIALVSATEPIDLSGPLGRLVATALATVAELESANTSERVLGAHAYLRREKRWGGGKPPYGYQVVANPDGAGYVLEVDDEAAEICREAVRRVIDGDAVNAIVADFNWRGVASPRDRTKLLAGKDPAGALWGATSLSKILRSRALLGYVVHHKASVPGEDGMPMTRAEPLIDALEFDAVGRAMDRAAKTKRRTQSASMLLNVAFCAKCGGPLYKWSKANRHGKTYSYYRCRNNYRGAGRPDRCTAKAIPCDLLDTAAGEVVLDAIGKKEITERTVVPGDNHDAEMAAVDTALADLTAQLNREVISDAEFDTKKAALRARKAELRVLPAEPDEVTEQGTGVTVAERWPELDTAAKGAFLRKHEVTLDVWHIDDASAHDPDVFPFSGPDTMTFIGNGLRIKVKGWTGLRGADLIDLTAAAS